jgi:hypothetical protein
MNDVMKRYMRNLTITMVLYTVSLFGSILLYKALPVHPAKSLIVLLPVIPILFGMRAFIQMVRNIDELQQRIQMEALAFSLGVTGILTFTYGFLEGVGWPKIGMIWVFPLSIALWGIGLAIATRRYK